MTDANLGFVGRAEPSVMPNVVTLGCKDDRGRREVQKFRNFLCGRKKAATSTASGSAMLPLVVVLPREATAGSDGECLIVAIYQPAVTEAAAKNSSSAAAAAAFPKKLPNWAPQAQRGAQSSPKHKVPAWGPSAKRTSSAGPAGASAAVVGKKRRMATMAEKIALGSQQHRDLGPDDTLRLPPAISWDTDRMVLMDPVSGRCVYYQDKGKRYRFITDAEEGMPLLCDLVITNRSLLEKNEEIMARRGDPMFLKQEGYHIYSEKPTLKSAVSNAAHAADACVIPPQAFL